MDVLRLVDAYCASCDDVRSHAVMTDDPSSCFCNHCGTCQTLVTPINPASSEDRMRRVMGRGRDSRPAPGEIWFSDRSNAKEAHRLADARKPGRHDIWSDENLLAGARLLAEAMQCQGDVDVLRLLAAQLRCTLDGARRRQVVAAARPADPIER